MNSWEYEVILDSIIEKEGSQFIFEITIMKREEVINGLGWISSNEK